MYAQYKSCNETIAGGKIAETDGAQLDVPMWPDTMCFQSDLSSTMPLFALKELNEEGRLKVSIL